jgi:hypothetical protein
VIETGIGINCRSEKNQQSDLLINSTKKINFSLDLLKNNKSAGNSSRSANLGTDILKRASICFQFVYSIYCQEN